MSQLRTQVELPDDLARRLDERAARDGESRSLLLRKAIEAYCYDEDDRERISREIVEGYERIPPADEEPW